MSTKTIIFPELPEAVRKTPNLADVKYTSVVYDQLKLLKINSTHGDASRLVTEMLEHPEYDGVYATYENTFKNKICANYFDGASNYKIESVAKLDNVSMYVDNKHICIYMII